MLGSTRPVGRRRRNEEVRLFDVELGDGVMAGPGDQASARPDDATSTCPADETAACLETGTEPLSDVRDTGHLGRLASAVWHLQRAAEAVDRAQLAMEIGDAAESIASSSIRDAIRGGCSWRE